jgi:hypothetical protein
VVNANGDEDGRIPVIGENVILQRSPLWEQDKSGSIKHSHSILATGRFVELGTDDKNIYFAEKVR